MSDSVLIRHAPPVYLPPAEQDGIQATVRLNVLIARDGTVKEVQPFSGHPLLVEAAMDAVRQWRYEPTYLAGRPVEVASQVGVDFKIGGAKQASHPHRAAWRAANGAGSRARPGRRACGGSP